MRVTFKLLIFLVTLFLSQWLWAQYKLVDSRIPIIETMTEPYKNKNLSLSDLDQIVRTISQDGLFQVVYVEELSPGQVIIRAQQSAKVQKIVFKGNQHFDEEELLEKMSVKTGEILSELEIIQAINRVKTAYQEAGYYNFRIRYEKSRIEKGISLSISIDEQKNCIIEDLQIYTKNEFLTDIFNELVLKYKQQAYRKTTSATILKEINDLLLENRFLTAKIQDASPVFNRDKTRVKLKYTVNNPIQFEFIFHGNKYFSHFDLIKKSQIGGKFLYLSDSSSEIVDAVREAYLKNGFPKVKIEESTEYFEKLSKRVFLFNIEEGSRVRIGKINIAGKISREKSFYTSLFNEYLAQEAHTVHFVAKDIEHAAQEMVTHLKRAGHLQAELLAVNPEFTEQDTADITIQIDEGILTYVRQILFRGSKSFSNIRLKEVIGVEPNKPLNIEQIENSFDKLETFYKNEAHLEFNIMNRNATVIQYKPGQPYADIVYQMSEGPRIKVKKIEISGNTKTKHYVVLRELDFKVGDYLTLERVSTSSDRLEKTGLFGKVNIRSLEQGSPKSERTIVVEVEDRKPGLFSAGVGVFNQGFLTYRGYLGVLYNNLGRKARAFSTRADLAYSQEIKYLENRITLSYYEPYITVNRLRGHVSLVRQQQLFEKLIDSSGASILSTNEFRFSVDKELSRSLRFSYNVWRFSNQETFEINSDGGVVDDGDSNKILNIGSTGPVFEIDFRNNQFLPTDGSYTRFELEYADPVLFSSRDNPGATGFNTDGTRIDENNEIQYAKINFSTTHYTPLTKSKRWVWANSISGGYLANVSSRDDSGVPASRSFFLGGASTLRGFNSLAGNEIVPGKRELCIAQKLIDPTITDESDPRSDCDLADVFVRSDSFYFLLKSELRFPISGNFGGSIFYDGGAVYLSEVQLEDPYRDSIGFGFRYDTPVGSFKLEFGYKLDRKTRALNEKFDDESEFAIHLAIGTF